jgi:hypothetical protein
MRSKVAFISTCKTRDANRRVLSIKSSLMSQFNFSSSTSYSISVDDTLMPYKPMCEGHRARQR